MQIQFSGKVSKNEYIKCLLLHNLQLKALKWFFGFFLIVFSVSIIYLSINGVVTFSYIFPGFLGMLVFLSFPWWLPYLQLSSFDKEGNFYKNNVLGLINETGITLKGGAISSHVQWSAYTFFRSTSEILLLYQGKNAFSIFTRSMFSTQADWENFISLAKEKVSFKK